VFPIGSLTGSRDRSFGVLAGMNNERYTRKSLPASFHLSTYTQVRGERGSSDRHAPFDVPELKTKVRVGEKQV
jgi:hypothetical protein